MGQKETLSLPGLPVAHYCHLCYGIAGYHGVEVQGTQRILHPTKLGLAGVQTARQSQKASQTQRLILCLFISCFGYCPVERGQDSLCWEQSRAQLSNAYLLGGAERMACLGCTWGVFWAPSGLGNMVNVGHRYAGYWAISHLATSLAISLGSWDTRAQHDWMCPELRLLVCAFQPIPSQVLDCPGGSCVPDGQPRALPSGGEDNLPQQIQAKAARQ